MALKSLTLKLSVHCHHCGAPTHVKGTSVGTLQSRNQHGALRSEPLGVFIYGRHNCCSRIRCEFSERRAPAHFLNVSLRRGSSDEIARRLGNWKGKT
jgi:hypothetical protein